MQAHRLTDEPIINSDHLIAAGGNINGPSLIRVPDWVSDPLGKYYLYFGHHNGKYIRLAYADQLTGPWQLYADGVLPLQQSFFKGHIASPDVHVDHEQQQIRMYFHGSDAETDLTTPQYTRAACSDDGLQFQTSKPILGNSYWRVFKLKQYWYSLEMPGVFYRARDPLGPFEKGPELFSPAMRHSAVLLVDDNLHVFYSNAGDCPESILHVCIDVATDWHQWRYRNITKLLSPQTDAEGAKCQIRPSIRGVADEPVCELRDPAIYVENDCYYLLYSVAGEQGIAIAELTL